MSLFSSIPLVPETTMVYPVSSKTVGTGCGIAITPGMPGFIGRAAIYADKSASPEVSEVMLTVKFPPEVGVPAREIFPETPAKNVHDVALQVALMPEGNPSTANAVEVMVNGKVCPLIAPVNAEN